MTVANPNFRKNLISLKIYKCQYLQKSNCVIKQDSRCSLPCTWSKFNCTLQMTWKNRKMIEGYFWKNIFPNPMQRKRSNKLFAVQIIKGTGANLKSWDYQGNKDRYIKKHIPLW